MLQRQDQGGISSTPNCVPETPFSPPLAPKVQTEAPVAQMSYKQSLRTFLQEPRTEPELMDEEVSDDDEINEDDDPACPRIRVTKEEKARLRRPWRRSLIIKLLGKQIGYNFLLRRLQTMWKPEGNMEIIDLDNDYYLARFENKLDYDFATFEGPWIIMDHYLVVQEWRPNFNPHSNEIEKLLVWARLPTLPIEYFEDDFLQKIGDKIGRTIKVDGTTSPVSRGKFARVCVEINITKPLLSKYTLGEMVWPIEYEGIHLICFNCGIYGHRQDQCGGRVETTTNDEGRQEGAPMAMEDDGNTMYRPALRQSKETRPLVGKERFGS
ncbi:uncharacterized protein LOC116033187 [Ipomoea triloba]|uniref:uncharacterized protein LOC116033187 n=1 Tax=Ipomoea triloba TaxID=35885 RepID=UPI00125E7902|nr:uncharacterized protein LOC116033187 [Ipomoea triloba]